MTLLRLLLVGVVCTALAGCALLGKSDPVVPRYFTPIDDAAPPQGKPQGNLRLHLGRIEGLAHLREPMVTRNPAHEIFYSEDRRWTERPEVYLRETISAALFQQRGVVEVLSGRAVALDAELTAFEELEKPQDTVRMQVTYLLHDERLALLQDTLTIDEPVAEAKGVSHEQAVVEAYSQALRAGVAQLTDRVVAKLNESAAAAP